MGRGTDLVGALLDPAAYDHPVRNIQVVETHISWVILTGDYAYKVKKPVDLGFLDFSTPERRKRCCEEEFRVNRRLASEIYLGVVPIGESPAGLRVGQEPAIEYAVKMRQFPHSARLDRRLRDGRLGRTDLRLLGEVISRFHESLPPRRDIQSGAEAERVLRPARNAFVYLDRVELSDGMQQRLAVIEGWMMERAHRLARVFERRAAGGAVREGHGDLHLENLLFLDGRFVPFDAIEFSANLRWIDTASDIAFLAMDLMAREYRGFAYDVLSAWLEAGGDYDSLAVMRYYLVYRSLVRAVVTAIRSRQGGAGYGEESVRPDMTRYVELAARLVDTPPPRLYLMHGLSGSGKTWLSERLVPGLGALRVRSDLERKRLLAAPGQLPSGLRGAGRIGAGLYSTEVTDQTYQVLARACATGLREGFDMIADAAFLSRDWRRRFIDLAASLGSTCAVVECRARPELLEERLRRRVAERADASDADAAVLAHQMQTREPLDADERTLAVTVETGTDSTEDILGRIARTHAG